MTPAPPPVERPPRLLLAPLEGVLDFPARRLVTECGGYDLCITAFVRVHDVPLPRRVFLRSAPELHPVPDAAHPPFSDDARPPTRGGRTAAGVPVRVQLLGSHPEAMAANAARAVALGSHGIDVNFGCPSRFVTRHGDGAALLRDPGAIARVIAAIRGALPPEQPISAKIRLGVREGSEVFEVVDALARGGADEVCIHARTLAGGFDAAALEWERLAEVRARCALPIIANGEIWSAADAARCRAVTGCADLMLGRGALATPNLARAISVGAPPLPWPEVAALLLRFRDLTGEAPPRRRGAESRAYFPARVKQWLTYLRRTYPEAAALFAAVRAHHEAAPIIAALRASRER